MSSEDEPARVIKTKLKKLNVSTLDRAIAVPFFLGGVIVLFFGIAVPFVSFDVGGAALQIIMAIVSILIGIALLFASLKLFFGQASVDCPKCSDRQKIFGYQDSFVCGNCKNKVVVDWE